MEEEKPNTFGEDHKRRIHCEVSFVLFSLTLDLYGSLLCRLA